MNHINTNRLYATIRSWPIIFIIFALVNFGFMMAFTTQANASGPSPPVCGNGAKESGEACDLGAGNGQPSSCCTSTCTYVAAGTVCRPKATGTECDVAETCPGNKDDCPVDRFEASSVLCGSTPVGLCDLQDKCQGQNVGPNCVDLVRDNQYDCRPSAGVCDLVETCDGMSKTCPPDSKSTAVCRPAAGECDLAESCDGGNNCPADVKKTNMTALLTSAMGQMLTASILPRRRGCRVEALIRQNVTMQILVMETEPAWITTSKTTQTVEMAARIVQTRISA
jgi:hypothetical protein